MTIPASPPEMKSRVCLYCGGALAKRRRKYCSDICAHRYFEEKVAPLWWTNARKIALRRANGKCEVCGAPATEVHHLDELKGLSRWKSPKNVAENLKALCHTCHRIARRKPEHKGLETKSAQLPLLVEVT